MSQHTEKLFSYGTLRYEAVQLANFGRQLQGVEDVLPGFFLSMIKIHEPHVIESSGEDMHPIVAYTGNMDDHVQGMVFDVSNDELRQADEYEAADYKRQVVRLISGVDAWVYVRSV